MFSASLVNNPFSDPVVYVKLKYRQEAFLFDLGDIHSLPPRSILRLKNVFISHTHMDHFIGFDHMLRICLGRNVHIALFGPPGFIDKVESKLRAYTWNLVETYTNDFILSVTELHEDCRYTCRFDCKNAFQRQEQALTAAISSDTVLSTDDFTVTSAFLDHRIPCLAYSVKESFHINIRKNVLQALNLPVGGWLNDLKQKIRRGFPDDTPVAVYAKHGQKGTYPPSIPLGELKKTLITITAGQKITYVTDVIYHPENAAKIIDLARDADILFIEASFIEEDAFKARKTYHLTARQAGKLAREAGVKNLRIFHFSPKYKGQEHLLFLEASRAFNPQAFST